MIANLGQTLLLVTACTIGFSAVQSLEVSNGVLEIHATIQTVPKKFSQGGYRLYGSIILVNTTQIPQRYSNKALTLDLNSQLKARTYLDSIASSPIDFASIEIKPGSPVSLKVYWVFDVTRKPVVESLVLKLDEVRK